MKRYSHLYQVREKLYKYHPRYYLGYGSNLNIEQMITRCPTAKPVAAVDLLDYKLVFSSVATVEPEDGGKVPCGVWYVEPDDIASLDIYEGFPDLYEKYYCTVEVEGQEKDAFFYALDIAYVLETPTSYYMATVEKGYDDFGLDKAPLIEAVLQADIAERASEANQRQCCWCGESFPRSQMHNEGRGSYLCNDCYDDMAYDLYGYKPSRNLAQEAWDDEYAGQLGLLDPNDYQDEDEYLRGDVEFDPAELDYTPRELYVG